MTKQSKKKKDKQIRERERETNKREREREGKSEGEERPSNFPLRGRNESVLGLITFRLRGL